MTLRRPLILVLVCVICVLSPAVFPGAYSYAGQTETYIDRSRITVPAIRDVSDALAHYIMGVMYDNDGNTQAAVSEYEAALAHKEDIAEIYFKMGSDFLVLGSLTKAAEIVTKGQALEPENTKSYLLLAIIYTAQGNLDKAQEQYEEALKYDPEDLKVLTFLSDLFIIRKQLDKAAEIYERILRIRNDDAFLYFNLGIIYTKLNLFEKAEKNLEKAITVDRDYLEAQLVLGVLYEIDGKFAEAIKQHNRVIEIDPLNKDAYVRLGQLYHRLGDTDKAIEQNRVLMKLDVRSPDPYLRNFSIYLSGEEYGKAEAVLLEALRNNVSDAVIYASLGYLANVKKDYDKAVEYYTVAVAEDPANHTYRFYLAAVMDQAGGRRETVTILEGLVAEDTQMPEAYNYLGYIYVEDGKDLERAALLIKKAVDMDPENGAYLDSLGWAYYKLGMLDEALEQIKKAVERIPDDAIIRSHLGDIYFAKGDRTAALVEWQKALDMDPGNRELRGKIKRGGL
ncbi:MAG: tetratricopeptide repeat protein [Candidatus Omnitrophota bacterium]